MAHHSILLHARLVALVVVGIGPIKERCTGGRILSLARSLGATFSAADSNAEPAATFAASAHAPALAVSGEVTQYSSSLRVRRVALVAVCVGPIEECCTGERILFLARSRGAT